MIELKYLASYILIILSIYILSKEKTGLSKKVFTSSIRAFIQLLFLGYTLVYIFKIENPFFLSLVILVMLIFASYTAQDRTNLKKGGYTKSFLSIASATIIVLGVLLALNIISFKPNEFIPVAGMIIGNSLNVYSLAIDRLKGEIKNNIELIENMIALGSSLKETIFFLKKEAIKNSLTLALNIMQTVGIIHIPGVTTGMLIAGVDPLKAISYQVAIIYMIVATSVLTAFFSIRLAYKEAFITAVEEKEKEK